MDIIVFYTMLINLTSSAFQIGKNKNSTSNDIDIKYIATEFL